MECVSKEDQVLRSGWQNLGVGLATNSVDVNTEQPMAPKEPVPLRLGWAPSHG